jgi:hypothetical protein
MSRVTLKSSTIFISVGNKTEVYRSVDDVPPPLRKQLEQSTNGIHSATILIADRKGKEEIVRAVRGLPSALRSRVNASLGEETPVPPNAICWPALCRDWMELVLPWAIGFAVWLLFSSKY